MVPHPTPGGVPHPTTGKIRHAKQVRFRVPHHFAAPRTCARFLLERCGYDTRAQFGRAIHQRALFHRPSVRFRALPATLPPFARWGRFGFTSTARRAREKRFSTIAPIASFSLACRRVHCVLKPLLSRGLWRERFPALRNAEKASLPLGVVVESPPSASRGSFRRVPEDCGASHPTRGITGPFMVARASLCPLRSRGLKRRHI